MLDDRKASILRAVVQEYIETAQPVGSGRIASTAGVAVSPATIRSEMVALEDQGYLHQPHTSAGRVPTEKGYRFYVDEMTGPAPLDRAREETIRDFFRRTHGEIERVLQDTSGLLARLTDTTAIVVGPMPDAVRIRTVQLIDLTTELALAVVVLSNGSVVKSTLDVPASTGAEELGHVGRYLEASLRGQALGSMHADLLPPAPNPQVAELGRRAVSAIAAEADHEARVYVEGAIASRARSKPWRPFVRCWASWRSSSSSSPCSVT